MTVVLVLCVQVLAEGAPFVEGEAAVTLAAALQQLDPEKYPSKKQAKRAINKNRVLVDGAM